MLATHPRLRAAASTALLLVVSVVQVGCGVLHCVEDPSRADVPPCHGAAEDTEGTASHAPGEGAGGCCVVTPLEPASSAQVAQAAPPISTHLTKHVANGAPSGIQRASRLVEARKHASLGIASPVPLRV